MCWVGGPRLASSRTVLDPQLTAPKVALPYATSNTRRLATTPRLAREGGGMRRLAGRDAPG